MSARALALLSVGAVAPAGLAPVALGAEPASGLEARAAAGLSAEAARWRLPHGVRGVRAAWSDLGVALGALERSAARAHPDAEALLAAHRGLRGEAGAWLARAEDGTPPASAQPRRDGLEARLAALAHRVARAYVQLEYAPVRQATARPGTEARAGAGTDNAQRRPSPLEPGGPGLPGAASGEVPQGVSVPAPGSVSADAVPLRESGPAPSTGTRLPETARRYLVSLKKALFSPPPPSEAPPAPGPDPRASLEPAPPSSAPAAPFPWRQALIALAVVAGGCVWLLGVRALVMRFDAPKQALERRLRRVAAPLTGAAAADAGAPGAESVFRTRERRARLAWVWRPIARRYPLLDPPRALAFAVGAGAAFAAFAWSALWLLQVSVGWWALALVGAAGASGGWQALRWQQARQEAAFIRQFPDVVDQMVRLAGAGVPSVEALSVVAADTQAPVRGVLREVCDALAAGLDADRALRLGTERARMAEFTLFAAVLRLQRRAGGAVSGAFANLAETLRERNKTALKARASTAQTRFTLLILTVMPVLVLLAQRFIAPESVEVLFGTESGVTLLRVGVGLIVTGLLVARAIAARAAR